jgi:hypothetical protein
VAQLRERLEILFRNARCPGVHTVSTLDRTLGLEGQRSFRQYYRSDRPSGIPGELLAPFLKLFSLRLHELTQPLAAFERLIESQSLGPTGISWHDAQSHAPRQEVTSAGVIRFTWPESKTELSLVPCSTTSPLVLPNLAHAAAAGRTRLRGQSPFQIELAQSGDRHPRMLGLLEGRDLICFLEPRELPGGELHRRLPDTLSLEPGPSSLWLLLLGDRAVADSDVQKLRAAEDTRTRRLGAEAIFAAAREHDAGSVTVLRIDLDVAS